MSRTTRAVAVFLLTSVLVGLVVFYVLGFLRSRPPAVSAVESNGGRTANLTLQTVASIGFGSHPDWVSYLVKEATDRIEFDHEFSPEQRIPPPIF